MTSRLAVLTAIALTGLVPAGCCGGDEGAPAAKAAAGPSLAAEADAVCRIANAKEAELGGGVPGWMFEDQFDDARFLKRFNDAGRAAARDLARLEAPEEDRDHMETMLAALDRMVAALDARIAALSSGKRESDAVNGYLGGYGDLVTAAGALGLSECQGVLLRGH